MTGVGAVLGRIQEIETAIKAFAPVAARSAAPAAAPAAAAAPQPSFASVLDALTAQGSASLDQAAAASKLPGSAPASSAPVTAQPAQAATAGAAPTASGDALVAEARKFLGVPYAWGGESMSGIDCSGLVQRSLGALGIDMPRVARDQAKEGTPVASLADARVGDLLVFDGGSHIAVYLGGGRMIDAPKPGDVVRERDVYETPTAIRRVLPDVTAASSTTAPASGAPGSTSPVDQLLASSAAQRSSLSLLLGAAA